MKTKRTLFAIPYAGGSSLSYSCWNSNIPQNFILAPIDPAGHGRRFREPLARDFESFVEDIYTQLKKRNPDGALVFGHSLGALVTAYALDQLYRQDHILPRAIILSACRAPEDFTNGKHIIGTEQELQDYLIEIRNLPPEIVSTLEYQRYIFPAVRNDFRIVSEFRYRDVQLPPCPVCCIYGEQDYGITHDSMRNWQKHCVTPIFWQMMPGSHFFLEENPKQICRLLEKIDNMID